MAFVVDFNPAAAIGKAAYSGGLGDYNRWLARQQLAYDSMANENMQRQQAQQFSALQQALGMQNQRQGRREEMGMRLALDEVSRRRELEDEARRREMELADSETAFSRQKEMAEMNQAAISERMAADDARRMEMSRREAVDTGLADGSWILEPSVQKRIDQINSDIGTWSNRDDVEEDVWRGKVEELSKRRDDLMYGSARQARPEERPKPTPQQFSEETVPLDMPDGSKIFVGRDRSGAWREITKWDPKEGGEQKAAQAAEKAAADSMKALQARKSQIQKDEKAYVEMSIKAAKERVDPNGTIPKNTVEKARKEYYEHHPEDATFMERFKLIEAFDSAQVTLPPNPMDMLTPPSPVAQGQAQAAPQAMPPPQQQPVAQQQIAPPSGFDFSDVSDEQLGRLLDSAVIERPGHREALLAEFQRRQNPQQQPPPQAPAVAGAQQAPVQQAAPMAPADKPDAPWDANTPLSIPDASNRQLMEIVQNPSSFQQSLVSMAQEELEARGVTQAPGKAPLNISELDEQSQAVAASMLPQPKSKAEFDALEKGTMFIAPDGSVRRK